MNNNRPRAGAVCCEKCKVRIPKNRPMLKCDICECIKHFKCNGLTKNEAFEIIEGRYHWTCQDCSYNILPINAVPEAETYKCHVCSKKINSSTAIVTCNLCDGKCHKKCSAGTLGCLKCCSDTIPGFGQNTINEIFNTNILNKTPVFNPYNCDHPINQIGIRETAEVEQMSLKAASEVLTHCEYITLKQLPSHCNGSPRIFSLNIRSLIKNIDNLRENATILQNKCDIICLCETNLKFHKLPNGVDDVCLAGFHEPIIQGPYHKSGKGGGLAIYINTQFCDKNSFNKLDLKCVIDIMNEHDSNPPGEFLFVKIGIKTNKNRQTKNIIIGNIYRSPSSNYPKFIDKLDKHLTKLDRHKNKIIHLVGDFNVDLTKYDTDLHCHELINKMSEHSFSQIISLPTRVTDHSATIIDHIYCNHVNVVSKSFVVTLDLSDHLGTYVQFSAGPNFLLSNGTSSATDDPPSEITNFRKFNATNMEKFENSISNESWEPVFNENSADEKYEKFVEIYNRHYDKAFVLNTSRRKMKEKILNLGYFLGWRMHVNAKIRHTMPKLYHQVPKIAQNTKN